MMAAVGDRGTSSAMPPSQLYCRKCDTSVVNISGPTGPSWTHSERRRADCLTLELMRNVSETVEYEKLGFGDAVPFPVRLEVARGRGASTKSTLTNARAATRDIIRWKKDGMPLGAAVYVRNHLPKLRIYLETHHQLEEASKD